MPCRMHARPDRKKKAPAKHEPQAEVQPEVRADLGGSFAAVGDDSASSEDDDKGKGSKRQRQMPQAGDSSATEKARAAKQAVYAPAGVHAWGNALNIEAACDYNCACGKRCLRSVAAEPSQCLIELYRFRAKFRKEAKASGSGGRRDTLRMRLERHFDAPSGAFSGSFRVACNGHVCLDAYLVACGCSVSTGERARADVTLERPTHAGRAGAKRDADTAARASLHAWIRDLRGDMERDKQTGTKFFTRKATARERWAAYVKERSLARQPCVGSEQLLAAVWKEHTEIHETTKTGHDLCDVCVALGKRLEDAPAAGPEKEAIRRDIADHTEYYRTEMAYAEQHHFAAEVQPVSALAQPPQPADRSLDASPPQSPQQRPHLRPGLTSPRTGPRRCGRPSAAAWCWMRLRRTR